jgi:hypothetical protein
MNSRHTTKLPLSELLKIMRPEQAEVCRKLHKDYASVVDVIPGSMGKHQAWQGGYISHIEEAMNIALVLHEGLNSCRQLDIDISEVLFCVFLHDFDKVQRYRKEKAKFVAKADYSSDYIKMTAALLRDDYGYTLTEEEYNALKYAHGEGDDYHPTDRIMLPLATLVHCSDIISARIWYDKGKEHDKW